LQKIERPVRLQLLMHWANKNWKLKDAHGRKSLPVAPPKELVLALCKMNLRTKFD